MLGEGDDEGQGPGLGLLLSVEGRSKGGQAAGASRVAVCHPRAGRRLHGREVIEVEIGHRDGRALLIERVERPPAKTAHLPLVKPTPS